MTNERSLMDELLRHRLEMLSKEIPEMKLAMQGNDLLLNVSVAYARQVVAKNLVLEQENAELRKRQDEQETDIAALRVRTEVILERVDKMSQIAKTKGW